MANENVENYIDDIEVPEENDGSLKITNLEEATRFAYGLSETRKEMLELQSIAEKEVSRWKDKIAEVEAWLEGELKPLTGKEEYLATQLQLFHMSQYNGAENEKAQKKVTSIKLPYGVTLKSRALADKLEITDAAHQLAYAKEHDYLKEPKPLEVDWSAMKKDLITNADGKVLNKETGEFLDFIKVVPQDRKFEVK